MKLSKEIYDYILKCIALEDKEWDIALDKKGDYTYIPMKEETTKWLKAIWDKQEKSKLKKLRDLKPGEGSSKLKDPKKKLEEWYAKNNVKIGI